MIISRPSVIEPDCDSLVIFDRDDTLSQDFGPMNGQSDCILMPNVIEGLLLLSEYRPILAIATNQSYIGRKKLTIQEVEEFHDKLLQILNEKGIKINLIAVCPHAPWQDCLCRKPKPGLLNELVTVSKIQDRNRIFFVGDKESDSEAATNAGVQGFRSYVSNFLSICETIKSKLGPV
jgi:D-glycero-D-manno-heptose 1,7-bisphosphate phosphatase